MMLLVHGVWHLTRTKVSTIDSNVEGVSNILFKNRKNNDGLQKEMFVFVVIFAFFFVIVISCCIWHSHSGMH